MNLLGRRGICLDAPVTDSPASHGRAASSMPFSACHTGGVRSKSDQRMALPECAHHRQPKTALQTCTGRQKLPSDTSHCTQAGSWKPCLRGDPLHHGFCLVMHKLPICGRPSRPALSQKFRCHVHCVQVAITALRVKLPCTTCASRMPVHRLQMAKRTYLALC